MKKFSPVVIFHLILMAALCVCSIFALCTFIGSFVSDDKEKLENLARAFLLLLVIAMLVFGILYLSKDYSKKAAVFYKTFLLLLAVVPAVSILIDILFTEMTALPVSWDTLYAVKIVVLLLLVFWKDLGKKKSWLLFYIVLTLDAVGLVLAILHMANTAFNLNIMGNITALIADGTVGLALRGKYQDKARRGSK